MNDLLSRPVRLAARLRGEDEATAAHLFADARVLIRLEEVVANAPDARETFLFAVNQTLRFCPNVAVYVPPVARDLVAAADEIAAHVYGDAHRVARAGVREVSGFQAVVNVGIGVKDALPWTTVNSTGWVARIATACSGTACLPWIPGPPNSIGALAAACLATGRAFLHLAEQTLDTQSLELSLFTWESGTLGSLSTGPSLPVVPLELHGFLIGCGAVTNGWAYTVKRLPVIGRIEAVDRQALQTENLGSYVAAGREWIGKPKAEMIAALLGPALAVTPRPEEWGLFRIRLRHGLLVPSVVVNGLDNVETRHAVQGLWPDILIDMAAGGLTSQLIVKPRRSDAICLLHALRRPENEIGWVERLARDTGLQAKRIREGATTLITEADVEAAVPDKRPMLEHARQQRQLVCGRITEQNIRFEGRNPDFAPAVPFVTGFSGVAGAAETMKWLMGARHGRGLHYQQSFQSGRGRRLELRCEPDCACQEAARH